MKKNNIDSNENFKNLASLNEELEYRWGFERIKNSNKNIKKFNIKAKIFIINNYNKVKAIKNKTINVNKQENYLENKILNWSTDHKKIKLDIFYNKTSFIELKKEFYSFKSIESNQKLLNKEKEAKLKQLETITNKLAKIKDSSSKKNKKITTLEIRITKIKTRLKDINGFLNSETKSRKLYLSDDPPLSTAGWIKLFISYAIILFWSSAILWPIIELVKVTFNDSAKSYISTSYYNIGIENFKVLINETKYGRWMLNTLIIAIITSALTVLSSLMMGYAFSRFRFKGKKTSLLSIMILQMIPTMAALTVFYVLYTLLNKSINMSPQIILIIIYVGGGIAGNTFIMKGYMDSISLEIDEAAKIDGLSKWKIFVRIIMPLCKPMIALVALWSFIGPFGDYIIPGLLLSDKNNYTLALGIRELISDAKNPLEGPFAAGSILVAVPIAVLFVSLRKFLIGGINSGGVKG